MATTPQGDDQSLREAILRGLAAQIVRQRGTAAKGKRTRPLASVTRATAGVPMAPITISQAAGR